MEPSWHWIWLCLFNVPFAASGWSGADSIFPSWLWIWRACWWREGLELRKESAGSGKNVCVCLSVLLMRRGLRFRYNTFLACLLSHAKKSMFGCKYVTVLAIFWFMQRGPVLWYDCVLVFVFCLSSWKEGNSSCVKIIRKSKWRVPVLASYLDSCREGCCSAKISRESSRWFFSRWIRWMILLQSLCN